MSAPVDLLVVGGGPAGLAVGIAAAGAGLSVRVVERRPLPLDKACGEGVMPGGVALLDAFGVAVPRDAVPFHGIRFVQGSRHVDGAFSARPGLGIRRPALIEALVARARALGVRLDHGHAVHGWHADEDGVEAATTSGTQRARWLVGADGLHSRVARRAGLVASSRGPRRFGMRRHFRIAPWSPFVEVHWSEDAEAYVTPVGPEEVGVALLWRGTGETYETLLGRFPALAARLAAAVPTSVVQGAGPFRRTLRRRYAGRVVLVGDAAGYLDPLTGEGVTLGMRTAVALVDTLAAGRPLAAYERAYRRVTRDYYRLTAAALLASRLPVARRRLVPMLAARPALFERLVRINAGDPSAPATRAAGALSAATSDATSWTA